MTIWANTIVNNEENFIWFALMSVIDFVDRILIYDTGSKDNTVKIIKEVAKMKRNKIILRQAGEANAEQISRLRQQMLEESNCDWIIILDGDEIWWKGSVKKVINKIKKYDDRIIAIVVPVVIPVGDIYHIQESAAGRYNLVGRKGHYNLRAINRKIPGLHVDLTYPLEGYFDKENNLIQDNKHTVFLNAPYFHATHLKRSGTKRNFDKNKSELGDPFPVGFKYPEVFYQSYPQFVPSPWVKITGIKLFKSQLLTLLRKINRRIFLLQRIKRGF